MTIYWHKDAGGKVTDAVPPAQGSEFSDIFVHSESLVDSFSVAARPGVLVPPLVRLQRELETAADIQEAVYALLRAIETLLDPALSCLVFTDPLEGNNEGYLFARFGGKSAVQRLPAGAIQISRLSSTKQAEWIDLIRSLWSQARAMPEHLGVDALCLPLRFQEKGVGILLIWPHARRSWPAAKLQTAYLALSLASSVIHRFLLQDTIQALQQELAKGQEQVSQAQERASRCERLASIGQVVSHVAHELNNPLTSVIGYTQLLRNDQIGHQAVKSVRIIEEQARHCRNIVQGLLGVARSCPAVPAPISLNEAISRMAELMQRSLENSGIHLVLGLESHMPGVLANPHHVQQVLVNLVHNAREAIVQSGRGSTLWVTTRVAERNGRPMAEVTVQDDGPGVPQDIRERIFEPYFTTKQDQGTGLGLSISRQLLLDMSGDLSLDTSVTDGARFVVYLPIASPGAPGTDLPSPTHQHQRAALSRPCGTTLVVEDDENLADLVQRALEGSCRTVVRAANGAEALEQVARHDVDLILLDVRMPQGDGARTYDCLQSQYPHLLSRLVFTTGDTANAQTRQWLESTGCPVLEKPFDLCQLRDLAQQFLPSER